MNQLASTKEKIPVTCRACILFFIISILSFLLVTEAVVITIVVVFVHSELVADDHIGCYYLFGMARHIQFMCMAECVL